MKKSLIYLFVFLSIFSAFFSTNLAFADDNNNDEFKRYRNVKAQNYYDESWKKLDKYNMRKTTNQDVVFDNQEGLLYYVKQYNEEFDPVIGRIRYNDNVSNTFNPLQSFWGAICDEPSRKFYSEDTVINLRQACKAHLKGAKSVMSVAFQSQNKTVKASLLIYVGNKNIEFNYYQNGFFTDVLTSEDTSQFIRIDVSISIGSNWKERPKHYNNIELSTSVPSANGRVFGLMGKPLDVNWLAYAPLYNEFKVNYPKDFDQNSKPSDSLNSAITQKNKSKFWPYFSYKVSKMNLNGFIIAVDSKGKEPFQITQVRPVYELYDKDKNNQIFRYAGNSLLDHFNYDFEEKGTYWVKTFIEVKPPMVNFGQSVEVIQPVWSKVLINGESYEVANTSFDESSSKRCDGESCDTPAFVENCAVLTSSNFGDFTRCSFNKIDTRAREQFGVIYSPVRFSQDIVGRLSNVNAVSCDFRIQNYTASVCFIQNRTPQLYTVIVILANGVLLFGFSIWLFNQSRKFFAGEGDED